MSKRQDWEPLGKIERQINEGKIWFVGGIIAIGLGALDAYYGERQIDSEFSRRFPAPITQSRAEDLRKRIEILNEEIVTNAISGNLPNEKTKRELFSLKESQKKFGEQVEYKKTLRNPLVNVDLSKPKSRIFLDVAGMITGTVAAAYGAWSRREGLMKQDWYKNN